MMTDEYIAALCSNFEREKMENMVLDFNHSKLTQMEQDAYESVRVAAQDLESEIVMLLMPSRETSLAITKLEEVVMWANKSIGINGVRGE